MGDRIRSDHISASAYRTYLRSEKWHQKAKACKRRAGWACERCGSKRKVEAHHLTYEHWRDELPNELAAICQVCHAGEHNPKVRQRLEQEYRWHERRPLPPPVLTQAENRIEAWDDLNGAAYQRAVELERSRKYEQARVRKFRR